MIAEEGDDQQLFPTRGPFRRALGSILSRVCNPRRVLN
jgi:hypothetical protein